MNPVEALEKVEAALLLVRGIIVEGTEHGFNPLAGGDWADRLFLSQADTSEAMKLIKEIKTSLSEKVCLPEHLDNPHNRAILGITPERANDV